MFAIAFDLVVAETTQRHPKGVSLRAVVEFHQAGEVVTRD
jgi:hypothetical protein